tara:strand:+ start:550 stop:810 length:261 start_codon:yes stop_codon:yes gene_type:complete
MVQNMNERILAKMHRDKILEDDSRKDELISIITHYFSSFPNVKKKWEGRYSAEVKTKTKKQTKGKQNAKAKENDNVVSITTDDSTD